MNEQGGYDLSSGEDALRLGNDLAMAWTDNIKRVVGSMESDEIRIMFFAALLGGQLGAMAACVGHERSKAIVEMVNEFGDKAAAKLAAERH